MPPPAAKWLHNSCRTDMSSMLPKCENNKITTVPCIQHTLHKLNNEMSINSAISCCFFSEYCTENTTIIDNSPSSFTYQVRIYLKDLHMFAWVVKKYMYGVYTIYLIMKQPAELLYKLRSYKENSHPHMSPPGEKVGQGSKNWPRFYMYIQNWDIFISLYLALNICQDHIKNKNLNEGDNNIEDKSKISFTPLKDTEG